MPSQATPAFDRLSRPAPSRLRRGLRWLSGVAVPSRVLRTRQGADAPAPLLTFDDGPDPERTPRILDVLGEIGARSTFFVVGVRAAAQAPLLRRIVAEGHVVANHSWSHPAPRSLSAPEYLRDVARARAALEDLTGASVPLFRPPHGFLTAPSLLGLWQAGHQVVLWSVDPKDYEAPDGTAVVDHLRRSALTRRDIVLLHDTSAATVEALPVIGAILDAAGTGPGR